MYCIITLRKISLTRDESYTGSSKWLETNKTTIYPKNNADKFFQYASTVVLTHEKIYIHTERR